MSIHHMHTHNILDAIHTIMGQVGTKTIMSKMGRIIFFKIKLKNYYLKIIIKIKLNYILKKRGFEIFAKLPKP